MSAHHPRRPVRRCVANPVEIAMAKAALLSLEDRPNLQAIVQAAFDGFRRGTDCPDHWLSMADALNMAESLADVGIASDEASRQRIAAGQRTLADVVQRRNAGGSWTLYAPEIVALDEALWVHRIQLDHCSLGEYERAERMTRNRVFQARHGNAPAGAIVVEGDIGREPGRLAA